MRVLWTHILLIFKAPGCIGLKADVIFAVHFLSLFTHLIDLQNICHYYKLPSEANNMK